MIQDITFDVIDKNTARNYTVTYDPSTNRVKVSNEVFGSTFREGDSIDRVQSVFKRRNVKIKNLKPGDVAGKFWGRSDEFVIKEILVS